MNEELIGRQPLDAERSEAVLREVFGIAGDDRITLRNDRGCKNMAIVGLVCQGADEGFIPGYKRFREGAMQAIR